MFGLRGIFEQVDLLVIASAVLLCGFASAIALSMIARARAEARRMRAHIAQLEATQQALTQTSSQLGQALDAAEAASKAKSAFLASMSHELRPPLNAMLGFSETLLAEPHGPVGSQRYREYLDGIHTSGAQLLSLINDILDMARFDAGQAENREDMFDTAAEIADTARLMAPQAEKAGISVVVDIAPALPHMRGDRRRIRLVLLNLLSNALKFTPARGTVTVRAYRVAEGLLIQVNDTGSGMRREDFSTALEPFGQVDSPSARKSESTGLGLPLTRQMVELHGGRLDLDSVLGQGTIVTAILPASRLIVPGNAAAECAA